MVAVRWRQSVTRWQKHIIWKEGVYYQLLWVVCSMAVNQMLRKQLSWSINSHARREPDSVSGNNTIWVAIWVFKWPFNTSNEFFAMQRKSFSEQYQICSSTRHIAAESSLALHSSTVGRGHNEDGGNSTVCQSKASDKSGPSCSVQFDNTSTQRYICLL